MKAGIGRMLLHSARCSLPSPKRQGMGVSNIPASSDFTSGHQLIRTHTQLEWQLEWHSLHCICTYCWSCASQRPAELLYCEVQLLQTSILLAQDPSVAIQELAELASEGRLWVLRKSQPGCGGDIAGAAVTKQTSHEPFTEQTTFAVSTPELVLKPLVLQQQLLSRAISPALAQPVNGAGRHLFWHDKEAEKFVGVQ